MPTRYPAATPEHAVTRQAHERTAKRVVLLPCGALARRTQNRDTGIKNPVHHQAMMYRRTLFSDRCVVASQRELPERIQTNLHSEQVFKEHEKGTAVPKSLENLNLLL